MCQETKIPFVGFLSFRCSGRIHWTVQHKPQDVINLSKLRLGESVWLLIRQQVAWLRIVNGVIMSQLYRRTVTELSLQGNQIRRARLHWRLDATTYCKGYRRLIQWVTNILFNFVLQPTILVQVSIWEEVWTEMRQQECET